MDRQRALHNAIIGTSDDDGSSPEAGSTAAEGELDDNVKYL